MTNFLDVRSLLIQSSIKAAATAHTPKPTASNQSSEVTDPMEKKVFSIQEIADFYENYKIKGQRITNKKSDTDKEYYELNTELDFISLLIVNPTGERLIEMDLKNKTLKANKQPIKDQERIKTITEKTKNQMYRIANDVEAKRAEVFDY